MDFGLGLPISRPDLLVDWATAAERSGFASIALLDRLVYDNPEPLIALSALAGATTSIRLQTEVLLGPLRSTALLAKQVATLDRMSNSRFTLGIGVGGRDDDHQAAGTARRSRGRDFDTQLRDLRRIWRGESFNDAGPIGPTPTNGGHPTVLIGGFADAALRRVAEHADGFICAAPPQWAGRLISSVREQWADSGRRGRPRIVCQLNVAIGTPAVIHDATTSIAAYYAFAGREGWGAPITSVPELLRTIEGFRELDADEVVLYCYGSDPDQVSDLATAVLS